MPTLRNLFLSNNGISNNIKFNVAGTNDACLLLVGDEHRTFKINNATDEFVDKNKAAVDMAMTMRGAVKK